MNNEIDELIKEIAVTHGIAVGRDDPILILQTINNRLMQNTLKAQQEQLEQFKSELEEMSQRWSIDTKAKAERVLNAALDASKDSMEKMMQDGSKGVVTAMNKELDTSLARTAKTIRDANRIGIMNIIAACITLLGAAVVLWVATH